VIDQEGTIYYAAEGEFKLFDMTTREARLFAINPDGSYKWDFLLLEDKVYFSEYAPAIGPDGKIYIDNGDGYVAFLYALNPDGTKAWEFATGQNTASSVVIGADSTIYVGGSTYVSPSHRIKLYALNPDGTEKWRFPKAGNPEKYSFNLSTPVIGTDGNIYFGIPGDSDGRLYALRPDGTELWSKLPWLGAMGESPPVIAPDGILYVGTGEGYTNQFVGFLFAVTTNSFGVANTAWPMEGHDPQRTHRAVGFPPCELPVITDQPKDSTILEGNAIKLIVSATGTGLNYQWYKGNDRSTPAGQGESFMTPDLYGTTSYWVEVSNICGIANSRTATISTTVTAITESVSGGFNVNIYPNPATKKVTVESVMFKTEDGTLTLFDFYGRKVFEKNIPAGTGNIEIDVSSLSSGMYFCRIVSRESYVIKKIVKL
jgi:hypothetical protein